MNSVNAFRLEGQKTIVYRALEFLNWEPPDWIVFPRGNMGNCSAFGKALQELYEWGWIKKVPRFAAVDAAGSNTFFTLFNGRYRGQALRWQGGNVDDALISEFYAHLVREGIRPKTTATAIQIGRPVNIKKGLRSLEFTEGISVEVTDREMEDGVAVVGSNGFDCEQASAACVAAIKNLVRDEVIAQDDTVVGILTGRLKDPQMIVDYRRNPRRRFANPPQRVTAGG